MNYETKQLIKEFAESGLMNENKNRRGKYAISLDKEMDKFDTIIVKELKKLKDNLEKIQNDIFQDVKTHFSDRIDAQYSVLRIKAFYDGIDIIFDIHGVNKPNFPTENEFREFFGWSPSIDIDKYGAKIKFYVKLMERLPLDSI